MADFVDEKKPIDDKEDKEEAGDGDDNAPAPVRFTLINLSLLCLLSIV